MSYAAYSLWRNELTMYSQSLLGISHLLSQWFCKWPCETCINILTVQISKAGIFSKTPILLWVNHIVLLYFFLQVRKGKKEFKMKSRYLCNGYSQLCSYHTLLVSNYHQLWCTIFKNSPKMTHTYFILLQEEQKRYTKITGCQGTKKLF